MDINECLTVRMKMVITIFLGRKAAYINPMLQISGENMDVGIIRLLNFGCPVQNIFEKHAFLAPETQCYLATIISFTHVRVHSMSFRLSFMNYFE